MKRLITITIVSLVTLFFINQNGYTQNPFDPFMKSKLDAKTQYHLDAAKTVLLNKKTKIVTQQRQIVTQQPMIMMYQQPMRSSRGGGGCST